MAFLTNLFRRNRQTMPAEPNHLPAPIQNNPNFRRFQQFNQIEKVVADRSILNRNLELEGAFDGIVGDFNSEEGFDSFIPVETNKPARLDQYRRISALPECDYCLEEIANDFIHTDEIDEFIKLEIKVSDEELSKERRKILKDEFDKFISFFDLENNGFELMKKLLIEGELAWENIINPKYPNLGIIGVRQIPAEYFETLFDKVTGLKIGIYIDKRKYASDLVRLMTQSYYVNRSVFDMSLGISGRYQFDSENCVAFLWPQITYINSGQCTPDGIISLPIIEKAKQAYYQYTLLKDSAVILRVTRAPERLLVNINTGNLPTKAALEKVREFANKMKQRKVLAANSQGAIQNEIGQGQMNGPATGVYHPPAMNEVFVFGKSNANDGTTIENIGASADYDKIDDLKFFLKILCKQFKIPWSRIEAPDSINEQSDSMSYEEYTFSRMIIRLQRRFAMGLKQGFITHLKLRGLYEKYGLKESKIKVEFVKPVLYDLSQSQRLLEIKMNMYTSVTDRDEFSKTMAMKKFLKMSDDDIRANYLDIVKEKAWMAAADYYAGKIDDTHTIDSILKKVNQFLNPVDSTIGDDNDDDRENPEPEEYTGNGGDEEPEIEGGEEPPEEEEEEGSSEMGNEPESPPEELNLEEP